MTDKGPEQLLRDIAQARQAMHPIRTKPPLNYYSMGMKMAVETISPLLVGLFIGYWIDNFFATRPLFMIILAFLGIGAGIKSVYSKNTK